LKGTLRLEVSLFDVHELLKQPLPCTRNCYWQNGLYFTTFDYIVPTRIGI